MQTIKVGVVSLGCDKNRVDTEKMLALLPKNCSIVTEVTLADIIIINTCAFLQASRSEAIEEILMAINVKKERPSVKIIVTGCLPQKFIDDIYTELPEVDAFMGVSDYDKIGKVINQILSGERVRFIGQPCGEPTTKRVLTTNGYAYLKIADGCSNHCTYCLIPYIRGKYRSVKMDEIITEAKNLGNLSELILVAQDTTAYGRDLNDGSSLTLLIQKLSELKNVNAIRLLYCYPENIDDSLIDQLKNNPKLIKYLDIPLQHADDGVLKLMNRKGSYQSYLDLITKLKREVPSIALRSTFITGFPQESEDAFNRLVEFIKKAQLFNAGFFAYSREEGTPAYKLPGQIAQSVKTKRVKKLYKTQLAVAKSIGKSLVGKTFSVVAEGFDNDRLTYFGRAYFNAPDVDGKIYFFSQKQVAYGKTYQVKITAVDGYDLYGDRQ